MVDDRTGPAPCSTSRKAVCVTLLSQSRPPPQGGRGLFVSVLGLGAAWLLRDPNTYSVTAQLRFAVALPGPRSGKAGVLRAASPLSTPPFFLFSDRGHCSGEQPEQLPYSTNSRRPQLSQNISSSGREGLSSADGLSVQHPVQVDPCTVTIARFPLARRRSR